MNTRVSSAGFCLFAILIVFSSVPARSNDDLSLLGRWDSGACLAAAAVGDVTYVGDGNFLTVVNQADLSAPVEMGQVAAPAPIVAVGARGSLVLAAAEDTELLVIDAADPAAPILVSTLPLVDVREIVFAGDLACVSDGATLRLIDLADPAAPVEVGSLANGVTIRGLDVAGTTVYLALEINGLRTVDISDPTQPTVLGELNPPYLIRYYDVAYCGDGHVAVAAGQDGLLTFDVSDPSAPVLAGEIDFLPVNPGRLAVQGDLVHLIGNPSATTSLLKLVDVSDPAWPGLFGGCEFDGEAGDVVTAAGRAYVVGKDRGLAAFDISDGYLPVLVSRFETGGRLGRVAVTGDLAVTVAGLGGLHVLDVSDTAQPTVVGHLSTGSRLHDVAARGGYAYLTDGDFHVVDLADPSQPVIVGQCDPGVALGITLRDDLAFVAASYMGLRIVDIAEPTNPHLIGIYDPFADAFVTDVAVYGVHAYLGVVVTGPGSVLILDISVPAAPQLVETLYGLDAQVMVAGGGYLYLNDYAGLKVLDLADPVAPVLVGQIDGLWINDLALRGDYLYAGLYGEGAAVIDVSLPPFPVLVDTYPTNGGASGLAVAGSHVFAAVPSNGLWIFDHTALVSAFDPELPTVTSLLGAFPNPFNPRTTVAFTVVHPQTVTLTLHDVTGRRLAVLSEGSYESGRHEMVWEGRDATGRAMPSGTYLLRMETPYGASSQKLSLIR